MVIILIKNKIRYVLYFAAILLQGRVLIMNTKGKNNERKRIIQTTLDSITQRRKAPDYVFFILLFLYIAVSVIIRVTSGSHDSIPIGRSEIPVAAFAGVLSSLSNICVIFLTLYFGKKRFLYVAYNAAYPVSRDNIGYHTSSQCK